MSIPSSVGENWIATVQLAPAAKLSPQLLLCEKKFGDAEKPVIPNGRKTSSLAFSHITPRQTTDIQITPQEFFAYATLKFQNPRIKGKQSFSQTKKKWRNILQREGDYLRFTKKNLIASSAAGSEDLTELSAVVGIGCGLIALGHAFDVNISRFKRFKPTNKVMRRMDFEFIASGRRYFHESKGTTSKYTGNKDQKDIFQQKKSTRKYCAKNACETSACSTPALR